MIWENNEKKNCRAQVQSFDLLFSVLVLVVLFGAAVVLFNNLLQNLELEQRQFRAQATAQNILDLLVMTAGTPGNWELQQDYNQPGLADSPRVINLSKIAYIQNANYAALKSKLKIQDYDFSVLVQNDANTFFEYIPQGIGNTHPIQAAAQRGVEYNGAMARFTITLYQ